MKTIRTINTGQTINIPGQRIRLDGNFHVISDVAFTILEGLGISHYYTVIHPDIDSMRNSGKPLVVIRDMGLGDVLMVTPTIRALSQMGLVVDVATIPVYVPLLDGNPYVRNTIPIIDGDYQCGYDHIPVDLRGYVENLDLSRHFMHRTDAFLGYVGLTGSRTIDYFLSDDEINLANTKLNDAFPHLTCGCGCGGRGNDLIGIVYKASHPLRSWSDNYIKDLIDVMINEYGYYVVLFSADRVQFDMNGCWNTTGTLSIREAIALINEMDTIVSPDTGLFHAASALNKPTVTYFSTFPLNLRASHDKVIDLASNRNCALWNCKTYCCLNKNEEGVVRCIDITIEEVIDAINRWN